MAVTEETKAELSQHSPQMPPAVVSSVDGRTCSGLEPGTPPTTENADRVARQRDDDSSDNDSEADDDDEDEPKSDYLDSLLEDNDEPNRSDPLMLMRGFNPQLKSDEEKSWTTLDSVHSKASTILEPVPGGGGSGCGSLDSSSDSFASFGASNGGLEGLDDMDDDLKESQAEFKRLEDAPKRSLLLARSSSVRMKRGPSFRGTLSLIAENGLD